MSRRLVRRLDAVLLAAVGIAAVSAFAIAAVHRRAALVVWSCGGNYQLLSEYVPRFERDHRCKVNYIAAPVQYLLEETVYGGGQPDIIVGRAGPGWLALKQCGKLAGDPTFFAVDPLVLVVPPQNPAGIRRIEDVGREGVRVAWTPHSMRPKCKVPALLMAELDTQFFPGLMDAWVRNAAESGKCGLTMLEPLLAGDADVAVAPRSLTTYPEYRGKLTVIPIQTKYLLAMKKGRASMPQCAGALESRPRADLARGFAEGLADPANADLLLKHGYLPVTSPECRPFGPMLNISVPRDSAGWMTRMAELLDRFGAVDEARRTYLKVIHVVGPSHYSARARYKLGRLAAEAGNVRVARHHWERVLREFPPPPPVEYDSRTLQVGPPIEGLEHMPYEHWIALARQGLAGLPAAKALGKPTLGVREEPLPLLESDPPKSGKRWLTLGEDQFRAGDPRYAVRDTLKVSTTCHPSKYAADAEYNIGVYELARGNPDLAVEQWRRAAAEFPGSEAARKAQAALTRFGDRAQPPTQAAPPMPPRADAFDTHALRDMTYGLRLYHHRLYLYAFKEMLKVIHGESAGTDLAAEARYRGGICCLALDEPKAAARQWALCEAHYPDSEWAKRAAEAMSAEGLGEPLPQLPPPPDPAKNMGHLHQLIGEELHDAGLFHDDEALLEYLKPLTTAMPKDPQSPLMARAALRAGVFLEETNRPAFAREMYEMAVRNWPEAPASKQARQRLARPE